jgi:hypothetical protein
MIALIYPKADYLAEEVALKLQLNFDWVYVIPKRDRIESIIQKKLSKVKYALYIAFDDVKLDPTTKNDINLLKQKNKKIIAIISKHHQMQFPADEIFTVDNSNIADIFRFVYSTIGEINLNTDYSHSIIKALIPIFALKLQPKT